MKFNPMAIVFWALGACIGGLIGGWHGALVGLTITMGLSFFIAIVSPK
jgi:hypothetical protein